MKQNQNQTEGVSCDANYKEIIKNAIVLHVYRDGRIYRPAYVSPKGSKMNSKWIVNNGNDGGYTQVGLNGKLYCYHRLIAEAWLEDYNEDLQVDHIDGSKNNNCVTNLRMVTNQENSRSFKKVKKNASSKYRGVCWNKGRAKWHVQCNEDGKLNYIGLFNDEQMAAQAYDLTALFLGFNKEALNFPEQYDDYLELIEGISNFEHLKDVTKAPIEKSYRGYKSKGRTVMKHFG